ncbi:MAG: hypothetical protein A2Y25_00170 [Candidatus Melainabacteria bacterium GWF2_37_15]|nr:MAG: hypothetical protein A2Y25_00170 [Candidatus Melainabacteria bacterium GWF2_37_15]
MVQKISGTDKALEARQLQSTTQVQTQAKKPVAEDTELGAALAGKAKDVQGNTQVDAEAQTEQPVAEDTEVGEALAGGKGKGHGLGNGGIPPGIQKKIDSGKGLPPGLEGKFPQLQEAIDAKKAEEEAAAEGEEPVEGEVDLQTAIGNLIDQILGLVQGGEDPTTAVTETVDGAAIPEESKPTIMDSLLNFVKNFFGIEEEAPAEEQAPVLEEPATTA